MFLKDKEELNTNGAARVRGSLVVKVDPQLKDR